MLRTAPLAPAVKLLLGLTHALTVPFSLALSLALLFGAQAVAAPAIARPGQEAVGKRNATQLFAAIRDQKDKAPAGLLNELGELKTDVALANLTKSVDVMKSRPAKQRVFSAMRFFLDDAKLGPRTIKFATRAALGNDEATAHAAASAMIYWGAPAKEALLEVAYDASVEAARSVSVGGVRDLLGKAADKDALRVILAAFEVGKSGTMAQGGDLIRQFRSKDMFKELSAFVDESKSPFHRRRMIVEAMGGHPAGTDPVVDEGVDDVLRAGAMSKDPVLEYWALNAMSRRGATENRRIIDKLTGSKDPTVRRAALVAGLRVGSKKADPFKLARDKDAVARQAAAIGLAEDASPKALELLHSLIGDEDYVVRIEVISALAKVRDASSIPVLIEQLAREGGRLRGDIRAALVTMSTKDLGTRVGAWRSFWKAEGPGYVMPSLETVALAAQKRAESRSDGGSQVAFYGLDIVSNSFALIIDTSGSMSAKSYEGKTRLAVAKEQLEKTMSRIRDGVLFNIIPFAGGAYPMEDGLVEMSPSQREAAIDFVSVLRPNGGTNIFESLSAAFEDERVDTIYLMSDGAPSAGEITEAAALRAEVLRWNSARKIVIHAIAVGQDHNLLKGLAEDSGGKYVRVD